MGSIVSTKRECNPDEVHPSESVALQAKLRQAAMAAQSGLAHSEQRAEGEMVESYMGDSEAQEDGFTDNVTSQLQESSAIVIQKTVRGYQTRRSLLNLHQNAQKIQRRFRRWKSSGDFSSTTLLSAPSTSSPARHLHTDDSLSEDPSRLQTMPHLHDNHENTQVRNKEGHLGIQPIWTPANSLSSSRSEPRIHVDNAQSRTGTVGTGQSVSRGGGRNTVKLFDQRKRAQSNDQAYTSEGSVWRPPIVMRSISTPNNASLLTPTLMMDLSEHAYTRDANIRRREESGEYHMYPPMSPGPRIKSPSRSRSRKIDKNGFTDLVCDDGLGGVKSIKLHNAQDKWIKSPQRQSKTVVKSAKRVQSAKTGFNRKERRTTELPQTFKVEPWPVDSQDTAHPNSSLLDTNLADDAPIDESLAEDVPIDEGLADDVSMEVTPELVRTLHSALRRELVPEDFGDNYILVKPSDVETLLRVAEFRRDIIRKLKLKNLTRALKLDYYEFLDDIEKTQFYSAQLLEASLVNYQPLTIVLISSTIPKCETLKDAVKPGVNAHVYDFTKGLDAILKSLGEILQSVTAGAKAKHIAIICKGGPGYFYLVKRVPVTPAKLRANKALLEFWRDLGVHMSKLIPGKSTIHLMESNMAGNKQGEKLLVDLESIMNAHKVRVQCPLEMSCNGREMINMYFDSAKYKLWKMTRYSKLQLYKP